MLQYFNQLSGKRSAWLLLALTAMLFEAIALWFQHVMLLKPCVLCIYQRCAMLGIVGAGVLGFIAPKTPLRYVALLVWLYSAWEGLQLAWQHTSLQLHPSPFATCEFATRFPDWLPLNNWLPSFFAATGDCAEKQWSFMTLEMPQWLVGIFAAYLIVGLLVLIAQPFRPKRRDLFSR